MNKVIYGNFPSEGSDSTKGGEPPMSGLEQRVSHLETQVAVVDNKIDNITENYATKADLEKSKNTLMIAIPGIIMGAYAVLETLPKFFN